MDGHNEINLATTFDGLKRIKGLRIIHSNCFGLLNKIPHLQIIISMLNLHIICISETNLPLHYYQHEVELPGYELYHRRHDGTGRGGVAIYVKSTVASEEQFFHTSDNIDFIGVTIRLRKAKPFTLVAIYHKTVSTVSESRHAFDTITGQIRGEIIVIGDFNMNPWNKLLDIFTDNQMVQLIKVATRIRGTCSSVIDLIFTNRADNIVSSGVLDHELSDHKTIYMVRKPNGKEEDKNGHILFKYRKWKDFYQKQFTNLNNRVLN